MASDNMGTLFLSSWGRYRIFGTFCSLGGNSYFFYPFLPYTFHKYSCKPILKGETLGFWCSPWVFRLRLTWLSQSFYHKWLLNDRRDLFLARICIIDTHNHNYNAVLSRLNLLQEGRCGLCSERIKVNETIISKVNSKRVKYFIRNVQKGCTCSKMIFLKMMGFSRYCWIGFFSIVNL